MVSMKSELRQALLLLRKHITKDLETREFFKDAFGFSNSLLFLLENEFEDTSLDNLVDWMNSYVKEVIVDKRITRSADTEITSALLGRYILAKHNRLRTHVNAEQINDILEGHIDDHGLCFKQNITYTVCLTLSLFGEKAAITDWAKMRKALALQYEKKNLHCDPKNLCYYALLLEMEQDDKCLTELTKWVADLLMKNGSNSHDKPYYLWLAWRYRKRIRRQFGAIKNSMSVSIQNFLARLEIEEDLQSRIIRSIYFDMTNGFFGRTILISYDEFHAPNVFARIGGFSVAFMILAGAIVAIYYSLKFGLFSYANLSLIPAGGFWVFVGGCLKFVSAILCLVLLIYLLWMALNFLWEVGLRNRYQPKEVLQILKQRSKIFFKPAIIIALIQLVITNYS